MRGVQAEIICNECSAVVKTVSASDLQRALDEVELSLDVTVYGGDGADKALAGVSSTLGGLNGAWYAHPFGLATLAAAETTGGKVDAAGNQLK